MNIVDKFLSLFGRHRSSMLGALSEQNDLKGYIYEIRARTYLRLTGKALTVPRLPDQNIDPEETLRNLSPARKLARKGL